MKVDIPNVDADTLKNHSHRYDFKIIFLRFSYVVYREEKKKG